MFGMPNHAPLSQAVELLTRPHERTVGEHTGEEPPLLELLRVAIRSDTSGASGEGGGGGSQVASNPVDVSALHLWNTINLCVGTYWPGRGDAAKRGTPLTHRLEIWAGVVADTENEPHLLEMCGYWAGQIRDLLEPPKRVPIRGGQCPRCKEHQVLGSDPDGVRVYQPTLLAHMSETPVRVECRACGGTWYNLDILGLEVEVALAAAKD